MEVYGILHVHTTYSHDGKLNLSELVRLCKVREYKFLIVTEHAEDMTRESMAKFVQECKLLSNKDLVVIPGLEFMCDDVHILGLGIVEILYASSPKALIDKIHEHDGVAVLAHMSYYEKIPWESLSGLDGVEIWNARYDGRFAPKIGCFRTLKKLKKFNHNFVGYCGLDLHSYYEFGKLSIIVDVKDEKIDSRMILDALKKGEFKITNGLITLSQEFRIRDEIILILFNSIYYPTLLSKKCVAKLFNALGVQPPEKLLKIIKRLL